MSADHIARLLWENKVAPLMGYCSWVRGPQSLEVLHVTKRSRLETQKYFMQLAQFWSFPSNITIKWWTHTHQRQRWLWFISDFHLCDRMSIVLTQRLQDPSWEQSCFQGAVSDFILLTSRWYVKPIITSLLWQQTFPGQAKVAQMFVKCVTGKGNP